jgi:hypothetical protein
MAASHTSDATHARPASTPASTPAATTVGSAVRDLLEASLHYVNGKLARETEHWVGKLDDFEARRGPAEQASYEGVKAELQGRNPIWAAAKGAWAGADGKLKLAAVLFVVLMLVLAPVPTLLIILGLLVAALINAIRAASQ